MDDATRQVADEFREASDDEAPLDHLIGWAREPAAGRAPHRVRVVRRSDGAPVPLQRVRRRDGRRYFRALPGARGPRLLDLRRCPR